MPDSSTGGYLAPSSGSPADDANLEAIVQRLIVGVSGLPGNMVRPTWQVNIPQQPSPATNWCAIQIQSITPDDNPAIIHDPVAETDTLYRHEEIEVLLSFYGITGQQYASQARDGLYLNQNDEALKTVNMVFVGTSPIRTASDFINQQAVRRFDFTLTLRRQVVRTYSILNILSATIGLETDQPILTETVQVTSN
jgi:hypothetical protein